VKARIAFGESPRCGSLDCWASPEFDDGAWTESVLPLSPNANIRSYPDYETGKQAGWMYYRLDLAIPEHLRLLKSEISFSPLYIQHQSFEVYLNGRLVFTGNGIGRGQIANFPLPKSDIIDGRVKLTFKASVTPEDVGITHYASMLLGPKASLDDIYVHQERAQFTYFLLFLLTKGSIFVVFTLFFYFTRGQPGLVYFLIFAFFVTVENLFIGDFLATQLGLNIRVVLFYACKAIAVAGLLGFFINFFHAYRIGKAARVASFLAVASVVGLAIDFGWGTKSVTYGMLWNTTNGLLVTTILAAMVMGLTDARRWRRKGVTGHQYTTIVRLTAFLGIYLGLIIWEFYFKSFGGFDKRAVFDLAFFIILALNTAIDMGLKEGQIRTLEGHMEEKRRMELELQEAAEIARAFLPRTAPDWAPFSIHTFHKPLTENSGDWYAFEASPSGNFYHFVMCDITGHGAQAAIVVSTCKSILSSMVLTNPALLEDPSFILHFCKSLNATLWSNGAGYHVSTLLGLTFEPRSGLLHYISAGHPSPLMVGAGGDGRPKALISRYNVLGIKPEFDAEMKQEPFKKDDQVIAYTDGLPLSSNVKALRTFMAARHGQGDDRAPFDLYQKIWESESARTSLTPNDDVSIVWFSAQSSAWKETGAA
jgi:hypothetical protein